MDMESTGEGGRPSPAEIRRQTPGEGEDVTVRSAGGREAWLSGDPAFCDWLLVQPVSAEDGGMAEEETAFLREACPGISVALAAVQTDWFNELAPWTAEPVFPGRPAFGAGAPELLREILDGLLPALLGGNHRPRLLLGGYSLAGLFALWAGCQTDVFEGIAAVSPSVWYPGWTEYAKAHPFRAKAAYLSLGDREAKTRHPLMRTADTALISQRETLEAQGIPVLLEWNPGNHFQNAAQRTAKGFAALISGRKA